MTPKGTRVSRETRRLMSVRRRETAAKAMGPLPEMKKCTRCGRYKRSKHFGIKRRRLRGHRRFSYHLASMCRECEARYAKRYRDRKKTWWQENKHRYRPARNE